jgi:hypothetical protein
MISSTTPVSKWLKILAEGIAAGETD